MIGECCDKVLLSCIVSGVGYIMVVWLVFGLIGLVLVWCRCEAC